MAVFAAIRGQHLCVPDLALLQERGKTSEGREAISGRAEQSSPQPCRVGRALPAREEHVPAPRSEPGGGKHGGELVVDGAGHSSAWAGGPRPQHLWMKPPRDSPQQSCSDNESQASLWDPWIHGGPTTRRRLAPSRPAEQTASGFFPP